MSVPVVTFVAGVATARSCCQLKVSYARASVLYVKIYADGE